MNKKTWSIKHDQIQFDRDFVIETINYFYNNISAEEQKLLFQSIINKIEIFEKKLFDRFKLYLHSDSKLDYNHINDIMFSMQLRIRYFISVCMQQEFRHLTL